MSKDKKPVAFRPSETISNWMDAVSKRLSDNGDKKVSASDIVKSQLERSITYNADVNYDVSFSELSRNSDAVFKKLHTKITSGHVLDNYEWYFLSQKLNDTYRSYSGDFCRSDLLISIISAFEALFEAAVSSGWAPGETDYYLSTNLISNTSRNHCRGNPVEEVRSGIKESKKKLSESPIYLGSGGILTRNLSVILPKVQLVDGLVHEFYSKYKFEIFSVALKGHILSQNKDKVRVALFGGDYETKASNTSNEYLEYGAFGLNFLSMGGRTSAILTHSATKDFSIDIGFDFSSLSEFMLSVMYSKNSPSLSVTIEKENDDVNGMVYLDHKNGHIWSLKKDSWVQLQGLAKKYFDDVEIAKIRAGAELLYGAI